MKRLPWSVTCLSPAQRQGEFLATQNPDGSLVLSALLKDEQGLLSFLLVPPSAEGTSTQTTSRRANYPAPGSPPTGGSTARNLIPMESEISFGA